MGDLTEHFSWSEFACKDGTPVPDSLESNVETLAKQLEILRHLLGDRPVTIVSGYRTVAYNKKCGGAKRSQHLLAKAADIRVKGLGVREIHAVIKQAILDGSVTKGGLGFYGSQGFVHYDIRGKYTVWTGSTAKSIG